MAKWRIAPTGDGRWWLMSGSNTLGKLNGQATAKQIVRDHNDLERARDELFAARAKMSATEAVCAHGKAEAHMLGARIEGQDDWCLGPDLPYGSEGDRA